MVKLLLILWGAVIGVERWVIITPGEEVNRQEISRWVEVLRTAEKVVDDFFPDPSVGVGWENGVLRVLRVAPSSGDFAAWTGCSIWQGAALKNGELIVQPLAVLERRGVLEEVVVHEYVHLVLEPYNVPLWVNEGLAVICSGQVRKFSQDAELKDLTEDKAEIEKLLASSDTLDLRLGYLAAARLTQEKIDGIGLDSLVRLIKEEAL
ncbi:hypothetical protein CEE36_03290 [candidate division TA06 bacterium B3_TA06]|uniref:Peptidase MA-like domain-containing protein n=1 Tax=candidate division TA06 bacterium B3_TA06 TaxID=2012487 RepID=A0A532V929_UNCT6|nr:MAG: hypothetical protein CEE36_03290 [candidate division TA06 bacterium B3_TA06]